VEAYAPASASLAQIEQRARLAAAKAAGAGSTIRYRHSILVPADETCFHLFEASSAELVRSAIERAGLRAQRIVEASTTEEATGRVSSGWSMTPEGTAATSVREERHG
jgi:Nickel responsive protein SCO4226-like